MIKLSIRQKRLLSIACILAFCSALWLMSRPSLSVDPNNANQIGLQRSGPTPTVTAADLVTNIGTGDSLTVTQSSAADDHTSKNPAVGADGVTNLRWTGEDYSGRIAVSNQDPATVYTHRVYFRFNSPDGYVQAGSNSQKLTVGQTYYTDPINNTNPYTFKKATGEDNTYYIEIPEPTVGSASSLPFVTRYDSGKSAGGDVEIWGVSLTDQENTNLGQGVQAPADNKVHKAVWDTHRNDVQAVKKALSDSELTNRPMAPWARDVLGNKAGVIAYDTASGKYYINNLTYALSMKRTVNVTRGYGEDNIKSITYTDSFTLPEGVFLDSTSTSFRKHWGSGTVNYLNMAHWTDGDRILAYAYDVSDVYGSLSDMSYDAATRTFTLTWTETNPNPDSMDLRPNTYFMLQFGDNILRVVNPASVGPNGEEPAVSSESAPLPGAEYQLTNNMSATADYSFSDDATTSAQATDTVKVKDGQLTANKSHNKSEVYRGEDVTFTVKTENTGSMPVTATKIHDELPPMFYLNEKQLAELFIDDANGEQLTVTIANARVCDYQDSRSVTLVDGTTANTDPQYAGDIARQNYDGPQTTDPCSSTDNATITISRTDKTITLTRTNPDAAASAKIEMMSYPADTIDVEGTAANIKTALKQLGYIVTAKSTYSLDWAIKDSVINGGQIEQRKFAARAKDDFQSLAKDDLWKNINSQDPGVQGGVAVNTATIIGDPNDPTTNVTVTDTQVTAKRQFAVNKNATVGGVNVEDGAAIDSGKVINYTLNVERTGGSVFYDALPMTDQMSGPQVLLAPVAENPGLAGKGLQTRVIDNVEYYLVSKPGTYKNVVFKAQVSGYGAVSQRLFTADTVTVTSLGNKGIQTRMHWYLQPGAFFPRVGTLTVSYGALVDPASTGYAEPVDPKAFGNIVFLGDHQTQRIYDSVRFVVARVGVDKGVVTQRGRVPAEDGLVKQSVLSSGIQVTYQLKISHFGQTSTVLGPGMLWDALPLSLNGTPWRASDISIEIPNQPGMRVTGGENWTITGTPPNNSDNSPSNQYLVWGEGFQATITGDSYIYLTLTYPSGEGWRQYRAEHLNDLLMNTFHVTDPQDGADHHAYVTHLIGGEAKAELQKSVIETGIARLALASGSTVCTPSGCNYGTAQGFIHEPDQDGTGRLIYSNASIYTSIRTSTGYVSYNVTLHNDGESRLYLNDIHDSIPDGFLYAGSLPSDGRQTVFGQNGETIGSGASGKPLDDLRTKPQAWLSNAADKPVTVGDGTDTNMVATIHPVIDWNDPTHLIFKVDNELAGSNLHYDSVRKKYYLGAGETLSFNYFAVAGENIDTKDIATNDVAMAYDDVYGTGTKVDNSLNIVSKPTWENPLNDDPARDIISNEQANKMGFSDPSSPAQWLHSDVSVSRQPAVPGISKNLVSKKATNGVVTKDPAYASYSDILNWQIKSYNDSLTPIDEYIISDVADPDYVFHGTVYLSVEDHRYDKDISENPPQWDTSIIQQKTRLFDFVEWKYDASGEPTSVDIKLELSYPWSPEKMKTLTVGGSPVICQDRNYHYYSVSLVKLADGRLRMDVQVSVPERDNTSPRIPLAPGSAAVLDVSTVNPKADGTYRTAFNEALFTPIKQLVNTGDTAHGIPTTQTVKPIESFSYWSYQNPDTNTVPDAPSVKASDSVPIASDAYTASTKSVTEKINPANTTDSQADKTFIDLVSRESIFTYQASVTNLKDDPIKHLVIIDNLPFEGDNYTFAQGPKRDSQFKVKFADEMNLAVTLKADDGTVTTVNPSHYTVYYSDKDANFDAGDWNGTSMTGWSTTRSATSRSIRVVVDDTARTDSQWALPGKGTINVRFDAQIDSGAAGHEIAWNSFGYHYTAPGTTNLELEAIPLKVGVRANSVTIQKRTTDTNGNALEMTQAGTFRFIMAKKAPATMNWNTNADEIGQQLSRGNVEFAVFEVNLKAGQSVSDVTEVAPAYKWTWSQADGFQPTQSAWVTDVNAEYTIGEIPSGSWKLDSTFKVTNDEECFPSGTPASESTGSVQKFTPSKGADLRVCASNTLKSWDFWVDKVNGDQPNKHLSGAVFGLYSTNRPAGMPDSELTGTTSSRGGTQVPNTYTQNGTTYYLVATQDVLGLNQCWVESSSGQFQISTNCPGLTTNGGTYDKTHADGRNHFDNLTEDSYLLVEAKAPDGFDLGEPIVINRADYENEAVPAVTVNNYEPYELPMTGGIGIWATLGFGVVVMGAASRALKRRRRLADC